MKADQVSSLFWLAVGLIAVYGSFLLGLGRLKEPGPGFLSFLTGSFISLIALIVFFRSFLRGRGLQVKLSVLWLGVNWKRPIVITLLALGYILALERLGFFLTGFLLILIMLKGVENLSWSKAIIIPVLTLGGAYLTFGIVLKSTLPRGIFGF